MRDRRVRLIGRGALWASVACGFVLTIALAWAMLVRGPEPTAIYPSPSEVAGWFFVPEVSRETLTRLAERAPHYRRGDVAHFSSGSTRYLLKASDAPGAHTRGCAIMDFEAKDNQSYIQTRCGWPWLALSGHRTSGDLDGLIRVRDRADGRGPIDLPLFPLWPGFLFDWALWSLVTLGGVAMARLVARAVRIARARCPLCKVQLGDDRVCAECGRHVPVLSDRFGALAKLLPLLRLGNPRIGVWFSLSRAVACAALGLVTALAVAVACAVAAPAVRVSGESYHMNGSPPDWLVALEEQANPTPPPAFSWASGAFWITTADVHSVYGPGLTWTRVRWSRVRTEDDLSPPTPIGEDMIMTCGYPRACLSAGRALDDGAWSTAWSAPFALDEPPIQRTGAWWTLPAGVAAPPAPVTPATRCVPHEVIPMGLAVNAGFFAGLWAIALIVLPVVRRAWRAAHDRCVRCAYEITGLDRCPECGLLPRTRRGGNATDPPQNSSTS